MCCDEKYIIVGGINDGVDAKLWQPMSQIEKKMFFNALEDSEKTRPTKLYADDSVPEKKAWNTTTRKVVKRQNINYLIRQRS